MQEEFNKSLNTIIDPNFNESEKLSAYSKLLSKTIV